MFTVDVLLWLAEMLSFNQTSLIQNRTQKERFLKKYRVCVCAKMCKNCKEKLLSVFESGYRRGGGVSDYLREGL